MIYQCQPTNKPAAPAAQLAKRCADFARANDMPIPHSGAFGHPMPSEVWFTSPGMMAQVQAIFDKARRDIPS